ncbi:Chanoclavine-I aldehyde reductase [Fonsecaea pedrosoi]|nr:Chanoclavine-I aldehyde reductase [Fonsecaea pedrosoi]
MSGERLFSPLQLGHAKLAHRIVMAPLTRFRADDDGVPMEFVPLYYAQRASTPGTLLITEATLISPRASGVANVPGIWSSKHIAAWKKVTDAVHEKKCFIFLQLWALGRRADPDLLQRAEGGPYPLVSASAVPLSKDASVPRALSHEEIQMFIDDYAAAARNAMAAGFDGVEIHGANGYLPDQFLQDVCNRRTDDYGGSIENRARFPLRVAKELIAAVGDSKRVAIRLSPWTDFDGQRMADPVPQFSHLISELKKLDLAYLHLVESRYAGDVANASYHVLTRRNDPFIQLWGSEAPIILAGGFTAETAKKATDEVYTNSNLCVAFGRFYISTPDLPYRLVEGLPLNPYHRESFYLKMSPAGYIDYPCSPEYMAAQHADMNGE